MNTTANLKQNLKKSAKAFTGEPLELLKSARAQITGEITEPVLNNETQTIQNEEEEQKYKIKKVESEGRTLQALESELKDIRRQKLFNDLMARIQNGEDVPLEEFSELSYEQKDVLKAEKEAIKNQSLKIKNQNDGLIEPNAKKGRQLFGQKQSAQKQITRVEKPVPPSG